MHEFAANASRTNPQETNDIAPVRRIGVAISGSRAESAAWGALTVPEPSARGKKNRSSVQARLRAAERRWPRHIMARLAGEDGHPG